MAGTKGEPGIQADLTVVDVKTDQLVELREPLSRQIAKAIQERVAPQLAHALDQMGDEGIEMARHQGGPAQVLAMGVIRNLRPPVGEGQGLGTVTPLQIYKLIATGAGLPAMIAEILFDNSCHRLGADFGPIDAEVGRIVPMRDSQTRQLVGRPFFLIFPWILLTNPGPHGIDTCQQVLFA